MLFLGGLELRQSSLSFELFLFLDGAVII